MPELTQSGWDAFLQEHPDAHLLQTSAWGLFKREFGWSPVWVRAGDSGAQVLFRRFPLGFTVAYLPKGPVGADCSALIPEVEAACRRRHAIFLRVEPDAWEPANLGKCLPGFTPVRPVQPRQTIIIRLEGSEEDWLARMKQKTRYNIRLAEKKEVSVCPSSDLNTFYRLMQQTGERDGFGVHTLAYYQKAYQHFHPAGQCELLAAEYNGRVLAMLMVFGRGARAWYFYGASGDEERSRMPTYLLQWEAMRWAAARGCTEYDLWGIPDATEADLEAGFNSRSDGLWGVYRFKRGFGGEIRRSVGAYEKAYRPLLYRAYRWYAARSGGEGD